ncbi:MAG: hypothetical protein M3438_09345 [Pseudomonadota bacterium]|nr:hypothetical protein [Sphingomonas sp.]MDQ3479347.1 hypothetical protein [Pseudomonadota bacterium]
MNPFEMVVIIVAIVMIAGVLKTRGASSHRRDRDPQNEIENLRLREEVKELKERLHVLERIATDRENSLSREIDELRDR